MNSPPSYIDIPSFEHTDQDYDTDDPLLDFCEDYAWDPSDWDLENQDHSSKWNVSDKDDDFLPAILPPRPSPEAPLQQPRTTEEGRTNSSCHGFGPSRYKHLLMKYYYSNLINKALRLKITKMRWVFFKWLFIVLNVIFEACQAIFIQENALGKISTSKYLKLSVLTSAFCLMISLVETIHEGKKSKRKELRLFGIFSLVLGFVSSMVQFFINLVSLVINDSFVKFDTLPLLLSSGYFVAALVGTLGSRRGNVIKRHGRGRRSKCPCNCKDDLSIRICGSYPDTLSINLL